MTEDSIKETVDWYYRVLYDNEVESEAPPPPLNSSLYSLKTFQALHTDCSCALLTKDYGHPEIKCSWKMDTQDVFKYISVASSTFAIAHTILNHGYKDFIPEYTSVGKRQIFYCYGVINLIYGITIGVYQVYIAGLTKTPWLFLLILPLILRIAPINVWFQILSNILPIDKVAQLFGSLTKGFKVSTMICSMFWFLGLTLGLESLADLLTSISRHIYGKARNYPFESVFPSIDVRTSCISTQGKVLFDCYRHNGWIDEATGDKVMQHVYPNYFGNSHSIDAFLVQELRDQIEHATYSHASKPKCRHSCKN